tara:strand:- start:1 stop:201 length:201 start_codon:yes stop_codon:yes gene_type:complete
MTEYTYEQIQEFFDQDTYGDLLDLLVDLVSGDYRLESLRMDIDEYVESRPPEQDGQYEIDYDGELV